MKGWRRLIVLFSILVILGFVSGCILFELGFGEYPRKELQIEEPGGATLLIDPGALSQKVDVSVEDVGPGERLGAGTPLVAVSKEYIIDIGEAEQIGAITMTVPLYSPGKLSAPSITERVYMTWAEPDGGTPSVVGTIVEDNQATFPVVGKGKYQVYSIFSHEELMAMFSLFDPLAVPTYQQRTPAWCSPTAMTNLVQFHEGSWPAGGFGHSWGESSNYYLAGKASQPFDSGYFFHWLLGAGGYTVPGDVKQSFSDGNVEVIIWNWKALVGSSSVSNPAYAAYLFNTFQAYVESYLWGLNAARRPVAWGSSLAGHSRTITGSNGTEFYYNDPSSGSLNQTRTWEEYKDTIIASLTAEKTEVIDTVVFHAAPRPEAERRGVIWLFPRKTDGYPGSVALVAGDTGEYATNWYWDGSGSHSNGYYHEDLRGILPIDPVFDSQFEANHYQDEVEIGYGVKNISTQSQDFVVSVALFNEDQSVNKSVHETVLSVGPGGTEYNNPADRFRIANLPPGLYTIMFVLRQSEVYIDVKFVQFRLDESELMFIVPHGFLKTRAFCRLGPDRLFDGVKIYEEGTEVKLLGTNPERTWGLFERLVDGEWIKCWIAFSVVDLTNEDDAAVVPVPDMPIIEVEKKKDGPSFSCSNFNNEPECMADSRCTWVHGIGPGYCTSK